MRASDSIFRKPPSEKGRFLKQNSLVDIAMFGERVVGIKVPIKMDLKVKCLRRSAATPSKAAQSG